MNIQNEANWPAYDQFASFFSFIFDGTSSADHRSAQYQVPLFASLEGEAGEPSLCFPLGEAIPVWGDGQATDDK